MVSGGATMRGFLSLQGSYRLSGDRSGAQYSLPDFQEFAFRWFEARVPKGTRVLDIGSGSGSWAGRLIEHGYDVVACDIHPDLCSVPCLEADLNRDFAARFDETFSAITFIEVIEHLENPRHALRQCKKLLEPGGLLFLTTPDASGLYSRVKFLFTGRFAMFDDRTYSDIGHITPLTVWQLEKCLAETGFEIAGRSDFDGTPHVPRTIGDIAKKAAWAARPFMAGRVGAQNVLLVCRSTKHAVDI